MKQKVSKVSNRYGEMRLKRLLQQDPYLAPYSEALLRRIRLVMETEHRLTGGKISLADFASGHEFFGLHRTASGWVFREWAPNATAVFLVGEFSSWGEDPLFELKRISPDGVWEISLQEAVLNHGDLYRLRVHWNGGSGDRIPVYVRRVHQDPETHIFNAQVWTPAPYIWRHDPPASKGPPLVYEVHVGMAQDREGIGSYREFTEKVLPRVVAAGYNTLQLMAIQQHPYYGSFGYHVANFFAASSRFGPPEDLKALIDAAHGAGLTVLMDMVHSHAVSNEVEGLGRFDGTVYQYFHEGSRGRHEAWDSRCFDYGKPQVLHFLLSNCRFWLDEYRVDGFRFDGVTSMLYTHHGLSRAFTSYDHYFDESVDEAALTYLTLANKLIHTLCPDAVTIAEDVSGLPGLGVPVADGGAGFDYRFSMGVPDLWIRLTKDTRDEDWHMGHLWFELNNRRPDEKSLSYAESHDQALVGDQSLMFRLCGADMYRHMYSGDDHLNIARGMALHKMIRLITIATAGHGYLNFMGNEFGHPEWIDFPREENGGSYKYARRQWHLVDHPDLKYRQLDRFDKEMIQLIRDRGVLTDPWPYLLHEHNDDKVIAFHRKNLLFVFNFHPTDSYTDYGIQVPPGTYRMALDSDDTVFGGHGRLVSAPAHHSMPEEDGDADVQLLKLYLPTRTAMVLERI
jgi:1,4-alpha-glucan branching enzyme